MKAFHTYIYFISIQVPMITMPHTLRPTLDTRQHFIVNEFWRVPVEWIFFGIVPAICVSILLFMETELTGVLMNKNSNKLKKSGGYNIGKDIYKSYSLIY